MAAVEDLPVHSRFLHTRLGRHLSGRIYCNLEAEGAELIDSVLDITRKEAEGCDCLQGF